MDPGLALAVVPPLATLAAMVFWIFRVRFSRAWGRPPRQPADAPAAAGGPGKRLIHQLQ